MPDLARDQLLGRLETEGLYLQRKYRGVEWDDEGGTWLLIGHFPIPHGWTQQGIAIEEVAILLDIPHQPGRTYPIAAPEWFWTDRTLRTSEGRSISHYFEDGSQYSRPEYAAQGWAHFCYHLRTWHAKTGREWWRGDSLVNYLEAIRLVFHDRARLMTR